jgi:4-alpha-glucanotransferase
MTTTITRNFSLQARTSGVLLHPTSLPGDSAFGDLGEDAKKFARFLHEAGQRWWQMCPLTPPLHGGSPYQSVSCFAGNPALIDLQELVADGLLLSTEIPRSTGASDFAAFHALKLRCLDLAFSRFKTRDQEAFQRFKEKNKYWLDDYALFSALRKHYGRQSWTRWPAALRRREPKILEQVRPHLASPIAFREFVQFVYHRQLESLKNVCVELGIGLLGDTSIYVAHDSADVWAHQSYFDLDAKGKPNAVGGTPPDLFTSDGQSWGMPTYRWSELKKDGYEWWIQRFKKDFDTFDALRLDHFIGYARFWRIPAGSKTAREGAWTPGPGPDFFQTVLAMLPNAQFVAEDLGEAGSDVEQIRDAFGFPGMKVLQFAFSPDPAAKPFLPENHRQNDVVYTGTHDNDTTVGWYEKLSPAERALLATYIKSPAAIHWKLIELAMASVANTAIVPFQDVLGLGSEARLNEPGRVDSNWKWRFQWEDVPDDLAEALRTLTKKSGRLGSAP